MSLFVGVDPGFKGAFCLLDPTSKRIRFVPTPDPADPTSIRVLLEWLTELNQHPVRIIGLEQVHSIQGTSAKSNFQFGRSLGLIESVCFASQIGVDYVQPKAWQKACGVVFPKKTPPAQKKRITAARAAALYPSAMLYGPRGGLLDGRADALLIAHYMSLKYEGALHAEETS